MEDGGLGGNAATPSAGGGLSSSFCLLSTMSSSQTSPEYVSRSQYIFNMNKIFLLLI